MGGRVCQWLAIDHPRKVRSMIQAASGSGSMGNPDYPRWLTVRSLQGMIEKGYKKHMWSHFKGPFFFPPEFVKAHPEVLEMLFKTFWENRPQLDPYSRHVIARNQHETGEFLDKITAPTLVLVGGEDKADADTGNHVITSEHLRDNIRNAESRSWKAAGTAFSGKSRRRLIGSFEIGTIACPRWYRSRLLMTFESRALIRTGCLAE
jgi:pimeloyl-ACP methyl ester carboxylesterase